jgi:hypothetical protein
MNRNTFDALTRRASLVALGAAGIAALGQTDRMSAKKKRDVNQLCKRQVGQCLAFFIPQCEDAACHARINLCCPQFGTCSLSGFYDCAQAAQSMSARQAVRPERT